MIPIKMMQIQMPDRKASSSHPARKHLETPDSVEVVNAICVALKP